MQNGIFPGAAHINFPRHSAAAAAASAARRAQPDMPPASMREVLPKQSAASTILLADDDPLIAATLGQGLRSAGFKVVEALDGEQALQACVRDQPSLAIVDYAMPEMSGVQLASQIAARTSIPVVFLSAYSEESIVNDAIGAGAMTYLVKPVDIVQLLPIVRSALQRARELQALRSQLANVLRKGPNISIATGMLMARLQLTQHEAFERLRRHARSTRSRLEDVAASLIHATEEVDKLYEGLSRGIRPRGDEDAER